MLTDALWAWWRLGEQTGERQDSSGNGRHLSDNGNVGAVPAGLGIGAVFSGTPGQYLSLAQALPPGSFSVALWVQLLAAAGGPSFWSQGDGASLQKLFCLSSNFRFATQDATGAWSAHGPLPAPWRHVAGVYDDDLRRITLFVDGVEKGHLDGENLTAGAAATAVGANPDGNTENLKGTVALLGLWTRALAGDEVAELYGGGAGLDYPFAA